MAQDKRDTLLAGWATAEITPAIPCWMGGYGARTRPADAIHDPLSAHALALSAATTEAHPLVLVICDLLDVHEFLLHHVRRRARRMLPGVTLWVGATHTHSGPALARIWLPEEAWREVDVLIERVAAGVLRAAEEAVTRLHPVYAAWASGETSGIVTNRDHPGSGENTAIDLLCFYSAGDRDASDAAGPHERRPDAIIGSFPCHPTVLDAGNYAISADLPGAFRCQLRTLVGADTWIALATGPGGDMSTRHTRQEQSMAELERLGRLLAQQAYRLISGAKPLEVAAPVVRQTTVELELKGPLMPTVLDAYERTIQARMAAAQLAGDVAGARTQETALQGIAALRRMTASPVPVERFAGVAVARMGELSLAAIPGELYNRLGVAIRSATGFPVLLCGYTNGYAGYLPTREAYEEIDYEVLTSPFAPGAGEQIAQAAQILLTQDNLEDSFRA